MLFAYGTLMTGYRNNFHLGASMSLGRARTCYKRFEMVIKVLLLQGQNRVVPFVNVNGQQYIQGELFAVTDPTVLAAIDLLEGHPDWYIRTSV